MRTWGNSWKKHEEPEDKNPHFLYTRLVLDLARPKLVNCWSPLNHASHCMTTSWSAVATQTRAWVNPAMQSKVFLCQMPFLPQPSLFSAWTPAQNNAGVHGLRLGIGPPRHSLKSQVILHLSLLYSDVCFIGLFYMAVWLSSSALVSINTVVLHQARLVLGWVTVWRQIQSRPRRDPDDISHCRILSPDKTEWQLISTTLCRWRRCFMADQQWLMKRIREEEVHKRCYNSTTWPLTYLQHTIVNWQKLLG